MSVATSKAKNIGTVVKNKQIEFTSTDLCNYWEGLYPLDEFNYTYEDWQYCYVIYNPNTKLVKIGKTNHINSRISQLCTQSGINMILLLAIELCPGRDESAKFVESNLHKWFKQKRLIGEWFDLSIRDICSIKKLFWEVIVGEDIIDYVKELYNEGKILNKKIAA